MITNEHFLEKPKKVMRVTEPILKTHTIPELRIFMEKKNIPYKKSNSRTELIKMILDYEAQKKKDDDLNFIKQIKLDLEEEKANTDLIMHKYNELIKSPETHSYSFSSLMENLRELKQNGDNVFEIIKEPMNEIEQYNKLLENLHPPKGRSKKKINEYMETKLNYENEINRIFTPSIQKIHSLYIDNKKKIDDIGRTFALTQSKYRDLSYDNLKNTLYSRFSNYDFYRRQYDQYKHILDYPKSYIENKNRLWKYQLEDMENRMRILQNKIDNLKTKKAKENNTAILNKSQISYDRNLKQRDREIKEIENIGLVIEPIKKKLKEITEDKKEIEFVMKYKQ
jgi:hypothetical protein